MYTVEERDKEPVALCWDTQARDATRSAYVRKIGYHEQPRWRDSLPQLPSLDARDTECLARRKPALHRQTEEHSHDYAVLHVYSILPQMFAKRTRLLSLLLSSSFRLLNGTIVNVSTFRRSQLRDTHKFQNCHHYNRRRWSSSRHMHAYIFSYFYSEYVCTTLCFVVRRLVSKICMGDICTRAESK